MDSHIPGALEPPPKRHRADVRVPNVELMRQHKHAPPARSMEQGLVGLSGTPGHPATSPGRPCSPKLAAASSSDADGAASDADSGLDDGSESPGSGDAQLSEGGSPSLSSPASPNPLEGAPLDAGGVSPRLAPPLMCQVAAPSSAALRSGGKPFCMVAQHHPKAWSDMVPTRCARLVASHALI